MPSPKPQPANLKLLHGTRPGRDSGGRKVKVAPDFRRLAPEPPAILGDGEALAEWNRIVPELQRLQLTKPIDASSLAAYCLTWERFCAAQLTVEVDGITARGSHGGIVKHPAVTVLEIASRELRAWASEFGLTPSSESRLGKGDNDDGDGKPSSPFA